MVDHCGPGLPSQVVRQKGAVSENGKSILLLRPLRAIRVSAGWIAVQVAVLVVVTAIVREMT